MQAPVSHPDRFKPEMPHIPGVNDNAAAMAKWKPAGRTLIVASALFAGVLGWWALHAGRSKASAAAAMNPSADVALPEIDSNPPASVPQHASGGGTSVATIEELAKPWSAKKFTFDDPATHQNVPAMIVRLPGVAGNHSDAYWAFSLNGPFEACQLEYVTDYGQLASRYSYRASHPMVLAACDGTLYDPLRVGTAPSGAWVRGEMVAGVGIRPPLSIEIRVQGNTIVADRME